MRRLGLLETLAGSRRSGRTKRGPRQPAAVLASATTTGQTLETRTMLTTYVVNSLLDTPAATSATADGNLTLREAITAANTNARFGDARAGGGIDSITFAPNLTTPGATLTLRQGELPIAGGTLEIDGGGVTLSGGNRSRVFAVGTGASLTVANLSNLTITRGVASSGGGIAVGGQLSQLNLDDVDLVGNRATGTGMSGGAGLDIDGAFSPAVVTISGGTIRNNVSAGSGGGILLGGGQLTVEGTEFGQNTAVRAGGAIEVQDGGDLVLDGVRAFNNSTGAAPGNGGMLHVTGGGSDVDVLGGVFVGNRAAAEGGALWNDAGSTMTVEGGVFRENIARGAMADQGGGALFNNGGTLSVEGGTYLTNRATGASGSGGAILSTDGALTVRNARFDGNTSVRAGGGIEVVTGETSLTNVVATGNRTIGGAGGPGNGGFFHITMAGRTTVSGGRYTGNFAAEEGGALWNSSDGTMAVSDAVFQNNVAAGADADQGGGAIFDDGGRTAIVGGAFLANRATGASGSGGALLSAGRLDVRTSRLLSNVARRAGGAVEFIGSQLFSLGNFYQSNRVGPAPGNGGAIHVGAGNSLIDRDTYDRNAASQEGGAVWNNAGSTMEIRDTTFRFNAAFGDDADTGGGALFNNGGTLVVSGGAVVGNVATGSSGSGGGLLSTDGDVTLQGTTFVRNRANRAGGAIEVIDGNLFLADAVLGGSQGNGNIAGSPLANPGNGGGIHVSGRASTTIDGGLIVGNRATREGGGLWNQAGAQMVVRNGTVLRDNVALGGDPDTGGGAIFNNGGALIVRDALVLNNRATGGSGSGGGIFTRTSDARTARGTTGTAEIVRTTFQGNTASRAGGAIEILTGSLFVLDSNFLSNVTGTPNANPGNGGAIHVTGPATTIVDGGLFADNVARNEGGALWNATASQMTVRGGAIFTNNIAFTDGGAMFNLGNLSLSIVRVLGNSARGMGGGLFAATGSRATLSNVQIAGNTPTDTAGPGRITNV